MNIIYGKEHGFETDFEGLLDTYWKKDNPDHVPLKFNWLMYQSLEKQGSAHTFCARNFRDRLVGFVIYYLLDHPHHEGYKVAFCDMISVAGDMRGQGIGKGLMRHAEPELIKLGAREIIHNHKLIYNNTPVFIGEGYVAKEVVYSKKVA